MRKFNTTDLFTGYLKQKLHDFNLPKLRVYTKEHQAYHDYAVEYNSTVAKPEDKIPEERFDILETVTTEVDSKGNTTYPEHLRYIPYIKDDKIQEYVDGKWIKVGDRNTEIGNHYHFYSYGIKLRNYTKNLKVNNNIYDPYTHEYLGDYLRFQRDYKGVDLMPLYNCFSNRACDRLSIKGKCVIESEETTDVVTKEFIFDTTDANHKIYMVPIKLFKTYTIAIDSELPVEFCCGIYGDYQDTRKKFKELPSLTYMKINRCRFAEPFVYSGALNLNEFTLGNSAVELAQNECDLKLFIKLPVNSTSTIVVLEGSYLNWTDYIYKPVNSSEIEVQYYGEGEPADSGDDLILTWVK